MLNRKFSIPKISLNGEAWSLWNMYGNEDFEEQYCHRTGKKVLWENFNETTRIKLIWKN